MSFFVKKARKHCLALRLIFGGSRFFQTLGADLVFTRMESALKFLEKHVIEDGQCVTKITILRQTSLKASEVEGLMSGFYEKHKDLPLFAMYLVFGTKKTGTDPVRHSVVCKQDTLEKAKDGFEKVTSVRFYSLYRDPALDIKGLLNADWTGKYKKPATPLTNRLGIVCTLATDPSELTGYPRMSDFEIRPFMNKVKAEPVSSIISLFGKNKQNSLKNAFANATADNDVDENMETEDSKELARKREMPNKTTPFDKKPKIENIPKTSKPLKKLPPNQSSIGSFFSKK